jgi:phospholipid transport system substrate-binding protein
MKSLILTVLFCFAQVAAAVAQTPCAPETGKTDKCAVTGGDPATMTPSQKIAAFQALVKAEIQKNMSDARKQAFMNKMNDYFDFPTMAEAALFGEWEKLTMEQRVQFSVAFAGMLQRNYLKKLYSHADYVATIGLEKLKDDKAQVATKLVRAQKGSSPVDVTYRLLKTKQGWRLYDVLTDEVSLVRNYRSTFAELFKSKGFSGLMDHLKKQNSGPLP